MKSRLIAILFSILVVIGANAQTEKLNDYIDNLLSSRDLAVGLHKDGEDHLHITTYLSRLKLKDPAKPVPANLEYDLWRHFCDCHHLCQVFYHQTYWIDRDYPIVKIMDDAFTGFTVAADGEGGVWINRAFEFLQSVDPHEKARRQSQEAEQGVGGQPATTPRVGD